MKNNTKDLIQIALDLTRNISSQDRFERLLSVDVGDLHRLAKRTDLK